MTVNAKRAVVDALSALEAPVYDSKTPKRSTPPYIVVRKIGNESFDYLERPGKEVVSHLRVDIVATKLSERETLEAAVHEIVADTGRMLDRNLFYEGLDPDTAGLEDSDVAYRATFQYRMTET